MPASTSARLAAVVASGALALGAAVGLGPGQATAAPSYTVTPILIHTHVGAHHDQPCTVSADLYRPSWLSARRKAAAIVSTNGFGGSKDDSQEKAIGRAFVRQGYVVITYSGLGFGHSGCKISLDDPLTDGEAGKQVVDVVAGTRPYVVDNGSSTKHFLRNVAMQAPGNPRVGMIGGSYGGQIQYAVAEQDRRVDAIIPIITWNDLSYSLAPNNTSFAHGVTYRTPGVAKKEWIDLFFSDGIASGVQSAVATMSPGSFTGTCPNFTDQACASAAQLNSAGYPDAATLALARHASVESYVRRIKVPTLLVQGERDTLFNLQEAVATYHSLRAQRTPVKMVWQSWGHSHSTPAPGELDLGAGLRRSYLGRRFLDWMNHYVRGQHQAPTGPRFAYFRDWVRYDTSPAAAGTAVARAYATASSFSERPTRTLYLSGSDSLVPRASGLRAGTASYASAGAPQSYSETSGVEGSQVNNPPSDPPGTFVAYTSPALRSPAVLVGSSRLTVHLQAPAAAQEQSSGPGGHLVLFAKIYDVAPDGTQTLQNRLISPVRVSDVTKPVHVELPGVVQRFATGHRIRLVIAASDMAYAGNEQGQSAQVTVSTSPRQPSTLGLPLRMLGSF